MPRPRRLPPRSRVSLSEPRRPAHPGGGELQRELARAARILAIRSRREARGPLAGGYASAFRGSGMEFDESRPYLPGDDVRSIDWNALARTGEVWVKRHREERDRLVMLALDVSASMAFGSGGRSKAITCAHAAGLLAAAAGRAGDRVGLIAFDEVVRESLPAARGLAHGWRVIAAALDHARRPRAGTDFAAAIGAMRSGLGQHGIAFLLSDFRRLGPATGDGGSDALERIAELAQRHDVVSIVVDDPRDQSLPAVGPLRVRDPEAPGHTLLLDTGSAALRARYASACRERRRALDRALHGAGSDVLWLRTDRDPLRALLRFFGERAARLRPGAA